MKMGLALQEAAILREHATFRYAGFLVERGSIEFTVKAGDDSGERVLRVSDQLVFLDGRGERLQPSR
jgi:hypothetical protein